MAIKTFSVSEDVYGRFSAYCRERGLNMSKQIQFFMESFIENEPSARKEYLERLEEIRRGKFVKMESFSERYVR
jgi:hypothetical protein